MLDKTYEDGIRAGLEMAVIIANRTTRGKTAADAINRPLGPTKQRIDFTEPRENQPFWNA